MTDTPDLAAAVKLVRAALDALRTPMITDVGWRGATRDITFNAWALLAEVDRLAGIVAAVEAVRDDTSRVTGARWIGEALDAALSAGVDGSEGER